MTGPDPLATPRRIAFAGDSTNERAWAAGFFDGEGHFGTSRDRVYAEIQQSGERGELVLARFANAIGVGHVRGPYERGGNRAVVWRCGITGASAVLAAAEHLWPWLGKPKRAQAVVAVRRWLNGTAAHRGALTVCGRLDALCDAPLAAVCTDGQCAWLAGFFDADGHIGLNARRNVLRLEIAQAGMERPELLDRAMSVAGQGSIAGPYGGYKGVERVPIWRYRLSDVEGIQQFIALVGPWLGPVKRDQAVDAIDAWRTRHHPRGWPGGARQTCPRGHPYDRIRTDRGRQTRSCRTCELAAERSYRERRRLRTSSTRGATC